MEKHPFPRLIAGSDGKNIMGRKITKRLNKGLTHPERFFVRCYVCSK
jgi:hypothetical protein